MTLIIFFLSKILINIAGADIQHFKRRHVGVIHCLLTVYEAADLYAHAFS
jgi:hypothetical protein